MNEILILLDLDVPQLDRMINRFEYGSSLYVLDLTTSFLEKSDRVLLEKTLVDSKTIDIIWLTIPSSSDVLELAKNQFFEWLDHVTNINININEKGNIKNIFKLDDDLSLWWLTGISQKKLNKTKILECFIKYQKFIEVKCLFENKICDDNYKVSMLGSDYFEYVAFESALTKIHNFNANGEFIPLRPKSKKPKLFLRLLFNLKNSIFLYCSLSWERLRYLKSSVDEINKPVIIATTNDVWEFHDVNDEHDNRVSITNNIYWPSLSENLESIGYKLIWLVTRINGSSKVRCTLRKNYGQYRAEMFPGFSVWLKIFKQFWRLHKNYHRLFVERNYIDTSYFSEGLNLHPWLKNEIATIIYGRSIEYALIKVAYETAFSRIKPSVILERKPFNEFGRLVISASKSAPVFGIQHGVVNDMQIGYLMSSLELGAEPHMNNIDYCPVPDQMLLFGKRMKDRMVNHNYPDKWITKIGNLKYDDIIFRFNENYPYNDIEKINVLLCLQYSSNISKRWAKLVANSIKQFGGKVNLLIKPHPQNESFGEIAKNAAICVGLETEKIQILTGSIDDVLLQSHLTVIHSSTVGIDSLVCNRPIVVIDEEGLENDNQIYKDSGVAFVIKDSKELSVLIERYLHDNIDWKQWQIQKNKFLSHHLENLDGKGFNRLNDLILSKTK